MVPLILRSEQARLNDGDTVRSQLTAGVLTGKAGVGVWGPRNVSILIWPDLAGATLWEHMETQLSRAVRCVHFLQVCYTAMK